ncbi:hypothetical protein ACSBL2_23835 [Pedobacter sp. AW31-3R]|uniref:hypothetical protein n=1 Tax=Pedobacter sp. AW31-3R TaxID=3445781 RepID=UPI003F9F5E44
MKITLDTKSLSIGFLAAAIGFATISSKSVTDTGGGRFRTEINNNNAVVILDTENGNYIIASDMIDAARGKWIKGEFYNTFKTAKGNKKE